MCLLTNSILANVIHNVHGLVNPKCTLKIIGMGKILIGCFNHFDIIRIWYVDHLDSMVLIICA